MALHKWIPEEAARIVELRDSDGLTWEQVAARLAEDLGENVTAEQARAVYKRRAIYEREKEKDQEVIPELSLKPSVLDTWREETEAGAPTWRELLEYAERGADLHKTLRPLRTSASRSVRADEPILVAFLSDLHFGANMTDYESFVKTSDTIMACPNCYIVITGPDLEHALNGFRSADAVVNQVMPPWMQLHAYKLWLEEIFPRVLAITGDNHVGERLRRLIGDLGLARPTGMPFFEAWGELNLGLDNKDGDPVKYQIMMAHRYKGSSIYHKLQPALRLFRDINPDADVYVTSHTHIPAHMDGVFFPTIRRRRPLRQHFIVTGSFKAGDLYSLQNFGNPGVLGVPTLALYPDVPKIVYFDDPATAISLYYPKK